MATNKNDMQTTDILNSEPMIANLASISTKLKISKTAERNTIEFKLTGITNIHDTALFRPVHWAVAVGEWLCRVCGDDPNNAHRALVRVHESIGESTLDDAEGKGLYDTGLGVVDSKGGEVSGTFTCSTGLTDAMRMTDGHIENILARWLLSICNDYIYDAGAYLNDGYMRVVAEQEPAPEVSVKFRVTK
jgi:hypothetical protein